VTIRLENGKIFTLIAKDSSLGDKDIPSVKLNGKPHDQIWFRHADITNGGTLELQMGNTPNRSLGGNQESLPPASASIYPEILTTGKNYPQP